MSIDVYKRQDLSCFDTSRVADMGSMFWYCDSLAALDVSSFNTASVTDMGYMFYGCSSLGQLDVSSFNTARVTDMSGMFQSCSVEFLDLSSFDTSKVSNGSYMLDCNKLRKDVYKRQVYALAADHDASESDIPDITFPFCVVDAHGQRIVDGSSEEWFFILEQLPGEEE